MCHPTWANAVVARHTSAATKSVDTMTAYYLPVLRVCKMLAVPVIGGGPPPGHGITSNIDSKALMLGQYFVVTAVGYIVES